MLRYDPTLPPANRRQFVLHRGRLADLRLDPAGDDEPDGDGATVARSDPPDDPLPPAAASLAASRVAVRPDTDRSQEQSR